MRRAVWCVAVVGWAACDRGGSAPARDPDPRTPVVASPVCTTGCGDDAGAPAPTLPRPVVVAPAASVGPTDAPRIETTSPTVQLGQVIGDERVAFEFAVKNTGGAVLRIEKIGTT